MLLLRGMGVAPGDEVLTPDWAKDEPAKPAAKPAPSSVPIWTDIMTALGIRPASAYVPAPKTADSGTNWPLIGGLTAAGVLVTVLVLKRR